MINNSKKYGFTLAEVLITLVVIGIVAAVTMQVIATNRDRENVTQVRKAYTIFSQALRMAYQSGESLDSILKASTDKAQAALAIMKYFSPYLNIGKVCGLEAGQGCFPKGVMYKRLKGTDYSILDNSADRAKIKLADGMSVAFYTKNTMGTGCTWADGNYNNFCGQFYIDVNGDKGPNRQGVDYFSFYFNEVEVIPEGAQGNAAEMVQSDCLDRNNASGWNCAAWVIAKDNLDYLHCKGLDWNTKTSCH